MVDITNQATVTANGITLGNWDSVSVRRDYAKGVSTFSFSVAEDPYGVNTLYPRFDVGTSVEIKFGGQTALTKGVITDRSVSYDKSSLQVAYIGQGQTYVATQGSIDLKQGNYNGYTFEQAANAVLQPLGIPLTFSADTDTASKAFDTLAVNPGESPAEFVTRIAAARGLFISDDGKGGIIANRKSAQGGSGATLQEGGNILSAHCSMKNDSLASTYRAVSQTKGSDTNFPPRGFSASSSQSAGISGLVNYLISEHPMDSEDLKVRAEHENAISTWTKFECNIEVNGWTGPDGKLWDPISNLSITVNSPLLFPNAPYQVVCGLQAVTLKQDIHTGSTSELELTLQSLLSKFSGLGDGAGAEGASSGSETADSPSGKVDPPDTSADTSEKDTGKTTPPDTNAPTTASKQTFPKDVDTGSDFDPDSNGVTST